MKYKGYEVILMTNEYNNGRLALQLIDAEEYLPFATCTVNIPEEDLAEDEVFIKNWSENQGMLGWLQDQNLIEEVVGEVRTGFTTAPKVKLNMNRIKELKGGE